MALTDEQGVMENPSLEYGEAGFDGDCVNGIGHRIKGATNGPVVFGWEQSGPGCH